MKTLIQALFGLLLLFPVSAHADPVLRTTSGICHCPGGDYYDGIKNAMRFADLQSCVASGGREPKRGQGDCSAASAVTQQVKKAQPVLEPNADRSGKTYRREAFGDGWLDFDGNCMNTRHELLKMTSTGNTVLSKNGCSVTHGRWNDPYTNKVFTNPRDLDIDHIVPLSFAWQHGADAWDAGKRAKFANDPVNLIAVDAPTNRQKSDSGPLKWLPPNVEYRCQYILRFTRISKSYGLIFSEPEAKDMRDLTSFLCD